MPSSPNYKRNYKQERKTSLKRGEAKGHAARLKARRKMQKLGMVKPHDGKDVDHKQPLSKGGAGTDIKNLRVQTPGKNRSFPRKPDGSIK